MNSRNTLSDQIYKTLREEIENLEISPGEKISEYKLVKRFQVGRSPIKNALVKLEKDGIVEIIPQVGTIVSRISVKKLKDILEVRLILEPSAVRKAINNITAGDLKKIEEKLDKIDNNDGDEEKKLKALYLADAAMHQLIWKRCENDEIYRIISNYRLEITRIQRSTYIFVENYVDGFLPASEELRALYNALRYKNAPEAEEIMRQHILHIQQAVTHFASAEPNTEFIKKEK